MPHWSWAALPAALLIALLLAFSKPLHGLGRQHAYAAHYAVAVQNPAAGELEITLRLQNFDAPQLLLGRATNAGDTDASATVSFQLQSARDADGLPLTVEETGGGWRISGVHDTATIQYKVALAARTQPGDFSAELFSHCDGDGARLLGADVFLFPMTGTPAALSADYELPEGWRLIHPFQTGEHSAAYPDLRALYHSVVAAGPYRSLTRDVNGCALTLAVMGEFRFSDDVLLDVLSRLVRYELAFMGDPPRPRYLFVVNPHPKTGDPERLHYFGLNFDGSMLLLIDGDTDRQRLNAEPAQLCAHEFFHNWLGETVRQHDYDMNWFIEGVTTFYAYQFRIDSGMLPFDDYADELRRRYREDYLRSPLFGRESVAEAGQTVLQDQAHTRFLYSGGVLLSAALDLAIDQSTGRRASLDDLVRRLVRRARADAGFMLTRESLAAELRELAGADLDPWLGRFVYGTAAPALPEYVTTVAGS